MTDDITNTIIGDAEPPSVHDAWMGVMEDVRAIAKGERNKVQGFSFRGIDAVMNAVGPVFRRHGVSCVPVRIVDARHRDFMAGKEGKTVMHEAIVTVEYEVTGPAGDSFIGQSIGESADASDKATTQAMSVALRTFLLQGLTMPTDEKDPDEVTVDRGAPPPPFDPAGAFAMLHEVHGTIAEPAFSEIQAWIESQGITPESLTKDQAAEWYERNEAAKKATPAPEPAKPPAAKKAAATKKAAAPTAAPPEAPPVDAGWRDAKDREDTWKGLVARQERLPSTDRTTIVNWGKEHGLALDTLTVNQAMDWERRLTEIEEGPF